MSLILKTDAHLIGVTVKTFQSLFPLTVTVSYKRQKYLYSYLLDKRTVLDKRINRKIWPQLEIKNLFFHSFD